MSTPSWAPGTALGPETGQEQSPRLWARAHTACFHGPTRRICACLAPKGPGPAPSWGGCCCGPCPTPPKGSTKRLPAAASQARGPRAGPAPQPRAPRVSERPQQQPRGAPAASGGFPVAAATNHHNLSSSKQGGPGLSTSTGLGLQRPSSALRPHRDWPLTPAGPMLVGAPPGTTWWEAWAGRWAASTFSSVTRDQVPPGTVGCSPCCRLFLTAPAVGRGARDPEARAPASGAAPDTLLQGTRGHSILLRVGHPWHLFLMRRV